MPPTPPDRARGAGLPVVAWPIAEGDIAGLCVRLHAIITARAADVVVCDVQALPASWRTVESLARLQLAARRADAAIRLARVSPALQELIDLAGLADVLPTTVATTASGPSRNRCP